jgi:hypothetical protein
VTYSNIVQDARAPIERVALAVTRANGRSPDAGSFPRLNSLRVIAPDAGTQMLPMRHRVPERTVWSVLRGDGLD